MLGEAGLTAGIRGNHDVFVLDNQANTTKLRMVVLLSCLPAFVPNLSFHVDGKRRAVIGILLLDTF